MALDHQAAWAAGLFDGEGYIRIRDDRRVVLGLEMTDADIVHRFKNTFAGMGHIYNRPARVRPHSKSGKSKPTCVFEVGNGPDVEHILKTILPYLGVRRSDRAVEALDVLRRRRSRKVA